MACLNARLVNKMKQRKAKSAIINLSSLAGINPIPYITLYSSSKAFNRILSEGLSIEYPEMDILAITPMHVESGSSNVKKQFNIPTSRECARDSLKQLRFGEYNSFGYLMHNITGTALLTFMPKWFLRIVSNIEMKKLIEKYYSKKE
jgi:17beta-estradiol 17-dehydrogenase / very-long-chain 3-oxoacyl-CoA reductase